MRSLILAAASAALFSAMTISSQAAVVLYTEEVGSDVQISYSGTLDLSGAGTGSPYGNSVNNIGIVIPSNSYFLNGADTAMEFRDFAFSGLTGSVGSGGQTNTSTYAGDPFYFSVSSFSGTVHGNIGTAVGYSGGFISGLVTFAGTTVAGLGMVQDATLVATLKSGDTITWNVSSDPAAVSAVPLPASLPLLFVALGGIAVAARRRKAA